MNKTTPRYPLKIRVHAMWIRVIDLIKKFLNMLRDPKFALCFLLAWLLTNGWSYIAIVLGLKFDIKPLYTAGITWQGILWLPFTIEKPITIAIAVAIHKFLFKRRRKWKKKS